MAKNVAKDQRPSRRQGDADAPRRAKQVQPGSDEADGLVATDADAGGERSRQARRHGRRKAGRRQRADHHHQDASSPTSRSGPSGYETRSVQPGPRRSQVTATDNAPRPKAEAQPVQAQRRWLDMARNIVTATIPAGQSLSNAVDLSAGTSCSSHAGAVDAGSCCRSRSLRQRDVRRSGRINGRELSFNVYLDGDRLDRCRRSWLAEIRSGSRYGAVVQSAARIITITEDDSPNVI